VVATQQYEEFIADFLPILVLTHIWFDLRSVYQANERQDNVDAQLKISVLGQKHQSDHHNLAPHDEKEVVKH
jgi:hypothetical protein